MKDSEISQESIENEKGKTKSKIKRAREHKVGDWREGVWQE